MRLDEHGAIDGAQEHLRHIAYEAEVGDGELLEHFLGDLLRAGYQHRVAKIMEGRLPVLRPRIVNLTHARAQSDVRARLDREFVTSLDRHVLSLYVDIAVDGFDADACKGVEAHLS